MGRLFDSHNLGLAPAIGYAALAWWLFDFLDKSASPRAKRAINEWISGGYRQLDISAAILGAFDDLYSSPLYRLKAFVRSAFYSAMVGTPFFLIWTFGPLRPLKESSFHYGMLLSIFAGNIVTDYVSLFLVRRWLTVFGSRPWLCLAIAPIIAVITIGAMYSLAFSAHYASLTNGRFFPTDIIYVYMHKDKIEILQAIYSLDRSIVLLYLPFVLPALIVYLWLPLMAVGAICLRAVRFLCSLVGGAQWFLKQGQHHPFKAIGFITAIIVFLVTAIL